MLDIIRIIVVLQINSTTSLNIKALLSFIVNKFIRTIVIIINIAIIQDIIETLIIVNMTNFIDESQVFYNKKVDLVIHFMDFFIIIINPKLFRVRNFFLLYFNFIFILSFCTTIST